MVTYTKLAINNLIKNCKKLLTKKIKKVIIKIVLAKNGFYAGVV